MIAKHSGRARVREVKLREMDSTKPLTRPPGLGFESNSDDVKPIAGVQDAIQDGPSSEPRAFPRRRPDLTDMEAERKATSESAKVGREVTE